MSVPKFIKLITGLKMPTTGFGTFQLTGDVLKEALDHALCIGYRHIDTALSYRNEKEVGEVIRDRINAGHLKRKDLFVTTKVPSAYMKKMDAIRSAEMSLDNLQLLYLDLLLIHHPWSLVNNGDGNLKPVTASGELAFSHVDLLETWQAFELLHDRKDTLHIGVSNFTIKQLQRLIPHMKVPVANVQSECHVYYQQHQLKEFCDTHGISFTAYAPLGAPGRPASHIQSSENILTDPDVVEIANKRKRNPGQILLNFLIKSGFVVLPKSSNCHRIKENFEVTDWSISSKEHKKLCELDRNLRFFSFQHMKNHPEFFENEAF